jgi:hypothetical protein
MDIAGPEPKEGLSHGARRLFFALTLPLLACGCVVEVGVRDGGDGASGAAAQHLTNADQLSPMQHRGRCAGGLPASRQRLEETLGRTGFVRDTGDSTSWDEMLQHLLCRSYVRQGACAPGSAADCALLDFVRACVRVEPDLDECVFGYKVQAARWERRQGQEAPLRADPRRDALQDEVRAAVDESHPPR